MIETGNLYAYQPDKIQTINDERREYFRVEIYCQHLSGGLMKIMQD
jgi:peptide methionine sulfoxide reductase MsrB